MKTGVPPAQPQAARLRLLLLAALGVAVGAFLIHQIYDVDVWWQVGIGRDILARGAVPDTDRYAAAALGRVYHDSHWIYQVLLAGADRLAGMVGVQWLMIVFWAAILFCLARAACRWCPPVYAVPLLFLAAMASTERFLPRPELVTYLGVAFFYWRLQEGRYRTARELAGLLAVQLLWVNGHGLFVLGPFLVGCYWLAAIAGDADVRRRELPVLSRALALLLLITLVTPYGWCNWGYALLLFQEAGPTAPQLLKSLGELSPTFGPANLNGVAFWFFLALLLVTAALVLWSLLRTRRLPPARALIVAGMLVAALTGRRNMVLFALVAAPFCAELAAAVGGRCRAWERPLAIIAAALMFAWAWYPLSGSYYLRMEIPSRFGWGATPSFFPHELPAFLNRIGYRGQVFNSNTLGGFYLYHRYPEQMPLTDGRWEVYDLQALDQIGLVGRTPGAWAQVVGRYAVNGVLLQHASLEARALLPELRRDPAWRLVYLDSAASFWLRADSGLPAPPLAVDASAVLPAVTRVDECMILDMFYQHLAADHLRLRNLERALLFGQREEWLLTAMGTTQVKLARYAEAGQTFERLLRLNPDSVVARNELAFLAYQRGDLAAAEQLLRQVLDLDPDNADARANYQRIRAAVPGGAGSR